MHAVNEADIRLLLDGVRTGALSPDDAVATLRRLPFADLGDAYKAGTSSSYLAGDYQSVTAGLTFYPISYVRFMANYTDGKFDNPVANSDVDLKQFQLRAQADF